MAPKLTSFFSQSFGLCQQFGHFGDLARFSEVFQEDTCRGWGSAHQEAASRSCPLLELSTGRKKSKKRHSCSGWERSQFRHLWGHLPPELRPPTGPFPFSAVRYQGFPRLSPPKKNTQSPIPGTAFELQDPRLKGRLTSSQRGADSTMRPGLREEGSPAPAGALCSLQAGPGRDSVGARGLRLRMPASLGAL